LYKIALARQAEKEYRDLFRREKVIFVRIRKAIHAIAKDPRQGKALKFELKRLWSYRVGPYRIIYSIEHSILTVYIIDIGHRREICRV